MCDYIKKLHYLVSQESDFVQDELSTMLRLKSYDGVWSMKGIGRQKGKSTYLP